MPECKCGCGGDATFDYLPGHDLAHTYKLIDKAGGRDNLENLLSYTGSAKLDLIFFDDKTNKQIDRISPLDVICQVGQVQRNVGGHPCWLVTKVGDPTVENWHEIPPKLFLPVFGHSI
jgi:hypothetical protein